ncbi:MAG: cyclophilin-like fold protein [Prevotellaceae bacterium]|nr:cyclophilin-like fold protein [Prevotellaceae bacterium]
MKLFTIISIVMCMTLSLSACESSSDVEELITDTVTTDDDSSSSDSNTEDETEEDSNNENNNDMITRMRITVNGHTLTATLEDNVTARAIAELLPMTLPMMDLYDREMCYRFPEALPTDNAYSRGYEVGEIVYYPPMHSFVIMYEQNGEHFQMQSIGRIDSGVEIFDGIGDVNVTFEAIE